MGVEFTPIATNPSIIRQATDYLYDSPKDLSPANPTFAKATQWADINEDERNDLPAVETAEFEERSPPK